MNTSIIQCKDVSHYYVGKAALNNISFEVQQGAPVGLVGPNGAGKTTLFAILCGFLQARSGNVSVLGCRPGAASLNGRMSALPQDAKLDPSFSVGKQLNFFARLQGFSAQQAVNEALRVLDMLALREFFAARPDDLSHGMSKRVAIAQALIGSPELILLDEPTAGLDPVNTRNVRAIIAELSSATTFIISSHDLAELGRLCQQILLLDKGVMSSTCLNDSGTGSASRFITLQMESVAENELMDKLKQLTGVIQVSNSQKNEFIIEYDPAIQAGVDVQVLMCLAENNWQYRQLSQGKTLEEKLFFTER